MVLLHYYIENGNPPFMVTRNLKGTSITTTNVLTSLNFDKKVKPFGQDRVVVGRRDGSIAIAVIADLDDEDARFTLNHLSSYFSPPTNNITLAIARTADE